MQIWDGLRCESVTYIYSVTCIMPHLMDEWISCTDMGFAERGLNTVAGVFLKQGSRGHSPKSYSYVYC